VRKNILRLHLYAALAAGLILIVVAVSGCLLVFELKMDRWLDPSVSYVQSQGEAAPYAKILLQLGAAYPGQRVTEINPGEPGTTTMARIGGRRVFVNPYTAQIVGSRAGEPASFHLRHLHRELMSGKVGSTIVNAASLLLVFQGLSGLYLWWPLKRTTVKLGASWQRVNFDLHHAAGFFSSAFICVIAITGLVKAYGDALQPLFDRATGSPTMIRDLPSKMPGPATVNIDQAVAAAHARLPGARVARIAMPKDAKGSIVVHMKFPGDSTAPGRSWVVMDQHSGAVLASLDSRTAPAGSHIPIINRAIHVGGIYGLPTRILAFLTSMAVLLQIGTGFAMWWRRRRAQPAVRDRASIGARFTTAADAR
jgi:uncharacterized iron-regulated membrane protein